MSGYRQRLACNTGENLSREIERAHLAQVTSDELNQRILHDENLEAPNTTTILFTRAFGKIEDV